MAPSLEPTHLDERLLCRVALCGLEVQLRPEAVQRRADDLERPRGAVQRALAKAPPFGLHERQAGVPDEARGLVDSLRGFGLTDRPNRYPDGR